MLEIGDSFRRVEVLSYLFMAHLLVHLVALRLGLAGGTTGGCLMPIAGRVFDSKPGLVGEQGMTLPSPPGRR